MKISIWNLADVITLWTLPTMRRLGRIVRGLPQIGWNACYFLLSCPCCLILRSGRTVAPILKVNGSNDVFPPKDGTFGGQDDGWRHAGKVPPKLPKSRPIHRNISETINPTNKRFEDRVQTTKSTSWVVRHYPQCKYNMADGRHLENRYDVIILQWMVRNSAPW